MALLLFCLPAAHAAGPDVPPNPIVNAAPAPEELGRGQDWLTAVEKNLAIAVLAFGVLVMLIQFVTLRTIVASNPELVIRSYAVTLIVVCTLFLVSAGLSVNQIGPGIGLFGTIAGYLLGSAGKPRGD
ncbi:hypothetical protein [Limobrevibacterium gyesilva]|uniref:Uncharacterized protein n=1 Tax=Limobrevibacterium gyesilva TaxID=2991712 RepID=A0AA41YRU6_9PROT|nr:hypothetical protein [Limobrevibacterium gyesilva]MCW3477178.1 hypothetical protein [Limobrevibacterium gyesilva]